MDVQTFHRRRIGFFIQPHTNEIFRFRGYPSTHEQYARDRLGIKWSEAQHWLRGFFWQPKNALFFYVGNDTREHDRVANQLIGNIRQLLQAVGGNCQTAINGGMNPGEPGTIWEPVKYYGTAVTLLHRYHDAEVGDG